MWSQCDTCGVQTVEKKASAESPYLYTLSGLSNVYLIGVIVRECPECGTESPIIPRIGQLHRIIAECLIDKPTSLVGEEIRYLRKYAGLPAWKFAAAIGESVEHVSRIENGKAKGGALGKPADKLVRLLAMDRETGQPLVDMLLKMMSQLKGAQPGPSVGSPTFRLDKRVGWRVA